MTDTTTFKPGDRVYVIDAGLASLRKIMRDATGREPAPNHHGTVSAGPWESPGSVLIEFDEGGAAPYPTGDVRRLTDEVT